jgi:flagellar motility protein MotE (MotC chaperone)
MPIPSRSVRLPIRISISVCILLAIGAHGWQLAQTNWEQLGATVQDAVMPPVTAAGGPPATKPVEPAALPAAPPALLPPALPAAPGPSAQDQVQSEMARLLEELKTRPRPAPAPAALPKGVDLARAAVAKRLDETAVKLTALEAQLKSYANASAAELAKPKALLENMKPAEAAAILTSMDESTAARISAAMDERKAAAMLAAMPSDRAARITLTIRSLTPDPTRQPVAQR